MSCRRGHTLIELLVSMAVGALLITAVFAAFVSTNRLLSWASARTDVGSAAVTGLNDIAINLRQSAYATLTIINTPPALSFRKEDPITNNLNGFVPEATFTVYYYDAAAQACIRKTWQDIRPGPLSPDPFSAGRLLPAQLQSIIAQSNGTEHPVATNVTAMTITPGTFPAAAVLNGIQVGLSLAKTDRAGPVCAENVMTMVQLRNHP